VLHRIISEVDVFLLEHLKQTAMAWRTEQHIRRQLLVSSCLISNEDGVGLG
jgi:hypothetical protein